MMKKIGIGNQSDVGPLVEEVQVRWPGHRPVYVTTSERLIAPGEVFLTTRAIADDLCREGRSDRFEEVMDTSEVDGDAAGS